MKLWLLALTFLTLGVFAESESQRYLRKSCEKRNIKACILLAKILREEDPESSKNYFQRACDLGQCEENFQKTVKVNKKLIKLTEEEKIERKITAKNFARQIRRDIASLDDCVDLMRALSQCRSYKCKAPHPLISDHEVIHHILRKGDHCMYSQFLPQGKKVHCSLSDNQTIDFESMTQLEAFAHISEMIDQKICKLEGN